MHQQPAKGVKTEGLSRHCKLCSGYHRGVRVLKCARPAKRHTCWEDNLIYFLNTGMPWEVVNLIGTEHENATLTQEVAEELHLRKSQVIDAIAALSKFSRAESPFPFLRKTYLGLELGFDSTMHYRLVGDVAVLTGMTEFAVTLDVQWCMCCMRIFTWEPVHFLNVILQPDVGVLIVAGDTVAIVSATELMETITNNLE